MSAGKPTLYPPGDTIPSAASIIELVKRTSPKSMMTVPFLLDDICNLPNDEGIKALVHMDFVGTGGAALGAGVGDRLVAGGVKLLNFYGATETGPLSLTFVPTDDYHWKYFRLRTDMNFKVTELEPRDGEKIFHLTVYPFGGTEGIEVADQLIRNKKYPRTDFAAVGRDDDIIILATGEKANPQILETMLTEAPTVSSAVAFGTNQFSLGVIIEPSQELSTENEVDVRRTVWPIITSAGQKMDAFSRVLSPDAIILVPAGTVIPRTDKGSIERKETYVLFQSEIKAVYERLNQASTDAVKPLDLDTMEDDLLALVRKNLKLQVPYSERTAEDSLFDLGIDSLQALQSRRFLTAAVCKTLTFEDVDVSKLIPLDFLYLHPSVREMATAILAKQPHENEVSFKDTTTEVNQLIETYRVSGHDMKKKLPNRSDNAVVLLTGGSGSLGSRCLAELVRRSQVTRVICLIRKDKGVKRPSIIDGVDIIRKILHHKGLKLTDDQWSKVKIVEVDPTAN